MNHRSLAVNAQRKGGNRSQHQKTDSQSKTGGAGGPSTGGAQGDKRQSKASGKS
jgi:hypothetical protein